MRFQCFRLGIAACALITPSVALATYSIAAVDMSTKEVGGAITSCVGSLDVGIVYGAVPGVGVIHAQAQLDQRGRAKMRALELMMQGIAPKEIIGEITGSSFDPASASRQYGLVDIMGRTAGFTGAQAQAYKRDQQGMRGSFAYSVQGNILTSQAVLDQATDAFEAPACDLAERLMRALEAGAENGEGDSRCTGDGIPSDSAYIQVDRPGQSEPYLRLSVADTGPQSPLPMLRKQFDAWRAMHPCVMPSGMQAGAAAMAGAGGAAGSAGSSGPASGAVAAGSGGSSGPASGAAASGGAAGIGSATTGGAGAMATSGAAGHGGATATSAGPALAGMSASTPATLTGASGAAAPSGAAAKAGATGAAGSSATHPGAAANSVNANTAQTPQAPQSSGCSLTTPTPHTRMFWLLTTAPALWLARRARRR
jgi:uncharacterized Ntn-hydrolase superfamily protein